MGWKELPISEGGRRRPRCRAARLATVTVVLFCAWARGFVWPEAVVDRDINRHLLSLGVLVCVCAALGVPASPTFS